MMGSQASCRFKVHLRPESLDLSGLDKDGVRSLPSGCAVIDILGDFLAYLLRCANKYITESHAYGTGLWDSFGDRIDFVLSHPNGWERLQQQTMLQAAINAGLIPGTMAGRSRVHFITEGEANLYYCFNSGLASRILKVGL